MSTRKPTPGIEARHTRACPSRTGERCTCTPTWQAHVWDARTAKRIRKTFATRTAAKLWRADAARALRTGELSGERGPTLTDAVDQWLVALRCGQVCNRSGDPYKPSAIRGYEQTLRLRVLPHLGHHRLGEIGPRDVQALTDRLVKDGWSPATIDAALTPLRALYRRAVARGEARHNPTLRIEKPAVRPKTKHVASPAQAARLLDALEGADRALWAVTFYAGLRRGELIGLRWEDVDLATGIIRVQRGWDMVEAIEVAPKSRRGRRTVPVAATLRDHLDQHRLDTGADNRVFASPNWVASANGRARARWETRGLPALTLHEGRHTFASLMIAAGVNAKALSTYMGHATIAVTYDLYGHLFPGSEAQAAGLLDTYLAREAGGSTVAQTVAQRAKTPC
jgi:integrase